MSHGHSARKAGGTGKLRHRSERLFQAVFEALETRQMLWSPPYLDYGYVSGTTYTGNPAAEWGEADEGTTINFDMGISDYEGDYISVESRTTPGWRRTPRRW